MRHEEFRERAGADPTHLDEALCQHRSECPECAAYHAGLLQFEDRLRSALAIWVPPAKTRAPARRTIWQYGLAAAAALVTVVSMGVFLSFPQQSLARAVAGHMDGEPAAFITTEPIDAVALDRVLKAANVELLPGGPTVTYAHDCIFRGHTVPHLAVLTPHGPVVVMVLTGDHVSARQHFSEHGYEGELFPTAHGSLAVVSKHPEDFDAIASAVAQRIRYLE